MAGQQEQLHEEAITQSVRPNMADNKQTVQPESTALTGWRKKAQLVVYRYILISFHLKGLRMAKMKNLYFLAPAQTKRMQPILVSWEEPFRSNLQKKNTGQVRVMTLTRPV